MYSNRVFLYGIFFIFTRSVHILESFHGSFCFSFFTEGTPLLPPNVDTSDPLLSWTTGPSLTWLNPSPVIDLNIPPTGPTNLTNVPMYVHPFYATLEGSQAGKGVYDISISLQYNNAFPVNGLGGPPARCNRLIYLDTPGPYNSTVPVLMMVGIWSYCNTTRANLGPTNSYYCFAPFRSPRSNEGRMRGISALSYDGGVTWNIGAYDPRLARCNTATVKVKLPNSNVTMACLLGGDMVPYGSPAFTLQPETDNNVCTYDGLVWFEIAKLPVPMNYGSATGMDETIIFYGAATYANTSATLISVAEYLPNCSSLVYNSSYLPSRCINITDWLPINSPPWEYNDKAVRLVPIVQYYPYGITQIESTNYSAPLVFMTGGFARLFNAIAAPDRKIWVLLIDQVQYLRQIVWTLPITNRSEIIPVRWTFMSQSMPLDLWNTYNSLVLLEGNITASTDLFPPNGITDDEQDKYVENPRYSLFLSKSNMYTFLGITPTNDFQTFSTGNMDLQSDVNVDDGSSTYGKYTPQPPFPSILGSPSIVIDMVLGFDPKVEWRIPLVYVLTDRQLSAGYTARCIFQKCTVGKEYPVPCKTNPWDAGCTDCKKCENNQYIFTACSYQLLTSTRLPVVRDTVCSNCTVCDDNGRITLVPCTPTTDTVCGQTYVFYTDIENILANSIRISFDYLLTGLCILFIVGSIGIFFQTYTKAQTWVRSQRLAIMRKLRENYIANGAVTMNQPMVYYPGYGHQVPSLFVPRGIPVQSKLRGRGVGETTVTNTANVLPSAVVGKMESVDTLSPSEISLFTSTDDGNDNSTQRTTMLYEVFTDTTTSSTTGTNSLSTSSTTVPLPKSSSSSTSSRQGSIVSLYPSRSSLVPSSVSAVVSSTTTTTNLTVPSGSSSVPQRDTVPKFSTNPSIDYPIITETDLPFFNVSLNLWSVLCHVEHIRYGYFINQYLLFMTYLGCLYTASHWCLAFALPAANDLRGGTHSEGYPILATSLLWLWGVCSVLSIIGISYIVHNEIRQGRFYGSMELYGIAKLFTDRSLRESLLITILFTIIHPRCIYLGYFFSLPPKLMKRFERYAMIITSIYEIINLSLVLVIGNWLGIPVAGWGRLLSTCALLGFFFVFISMVQLVLERYTSSLRRIVWVPSYPTDMDRNSVSSGTSYPTDGAGGNENGRPSSKVTTINSSTVWFPEDKNDEYRTMYRSPIPNNSVLRRNNGPTIIVSKNTEEDKFSSAVRGSTNGSSRTVLNPVRAIRVSQMLNGSTDMSGIFLSPTLSVGDNVVQYRENIANVSVTSTNALEDERDDPLSLGSNPRERNVVTVAISKEKKDVKDVDNNNKDSRSSSSNNSTVAEVPNLPVSLSFTSLDNKEIVFPTVTAEEEEEENIKIRMLLHPMIVRTVGSCRGGVQPVSTVVVNYRGDSVTDKRIMTDNRVIRLDETECVQYLEEEER